MILADKIAHLRKKQGWSQEDLAQQTGVSRQAVSKWESSASVPDLDKLLKMSQLFGVSTDYLLKDEMEEEAPAPAERLEEETAPTVSLEQAGDYMDLMKKYAPRTAAAVGLLILSPVVLLVLAGASAAGQGAISEDMAGGLGTAILLVMVALGTVQLILNDARFEKYRFLDKVRFGLQYGAKGLVEKRKEAFAATHRKGMALGTALCIVGAVPLMLAAAMGAGDMVYMYCVAMLLCLIAAGVYCFVWTGCIQESFDKLLQVGEYTPEEKALRRRTAFFPPAYWCTATAVYLGISFYFDNWKRSWIVWPVAGVLFAALYAVVRAVLRGRQAE